MKALVTLYGRPGCHLCDQAREELLKAREGGHDFDLREVDIEGDPELLKRYLERIPVVAVNGEVASELGLDADGLRARLATVST